MAARGALKLSLVAVLVVVGLAVAGLLLALNEKSPTAAAQEFLTALAKKDVDRLVSLSYLESPVRPLREQWDFCVNVAAKNYVFLWTIETEKLRRVGDTEAVVPVILWEFHGPFGNETDPIELPLVYRDGRWKVDLLSLSRKFFPALPR